MKKVFYTTAFIISLGFAMSLNSCQDDPITPNNPNDDNIDTTWTGIDDSTNVDDPNGGGTIDDSTGWTNPNDTTIVDPNGGGTPTDTTGGGGNGSPNDSTWTP